MIADRYVANIYCNNVDMSEGEETPLLDLKGVHEGVLSFAKFPATVDALWVLTRIYSPSARPMSQLRVSFLLDDEILSEETYEESELANPSGDPNSATAVQRISVLFRLKQFEVKSESRISCIVEADGLRIPAEPLKITKKPLPQVAPLRTSTKETKKTANPPQVTKTRKSTSGQSTLKTKSSRAARPRSKA